MNFESPFKTNLMQFDESSTKAIVDCDINGWMETNVKKRATNKPAIKKLMRQMGRANIDHADRSNIALLKEKKEMLLNSTARKQSQKMVPQTAASSNATPCLTISSSKLKFNIQIRSLSKGDKKQSKQIEVSQFTLDEPKELKKGLRQKLKINISQLVRIKQLQKAPSFKLKNFTSRPAVRQPMLPEKYHLDESITFIRTKVTGNNYRGLSFISRKLTPRHVA